VKERTVELEKLNRELQDFVYIASHDLREPLRKVIMFGKMMLEKISPLLDDTTRDFSERMQKAVLRMQALLDSLLNYSRITTKSDLYNETNLEQSVETALSNLEIMVSERKARVEVGDLPTIKADRVQMVQLFQNLISNALKFNQDIPHVRIFSEPSGNNKGTFDISVADNGIGIDESHREQIFFPFQRLHGRTAYEGTGIGLSICRKIVERHGGTIRVNSRPGKGSTFMVTLPSDPT
jgi:light-regulated signal transduction histidine kinase (bacteriophytochrome)